MQFRDITIDELPKILELEKEYTSSEESLGEITERFKKFPKLFVVVEEGNELIGEVSGLVRDNKVIIKSISVKETHRKEDLGKQLLEYFETQAKLYRNVVSVAAGGNVESFYQKCGYKFTQILIQVSSTHFFAQLV